MLLCLLLLTIHRLIDIPFTFAQQSILDSSNQQHKIRLYGIHTLEKKQAFGKAAKQFTANLTAGKTVNVTAYDTDRYERTVGVD